LEVHFHPLPSCQRRHHTQTSFHWLGKMPHFQGIFHWYIYSVNLSCQWICLTALQHVSHVHHQHLHPCHPHRASPVLVWLTWEHIFASDCRTCYAARVAQSVLYVFFGQCSAYTMSSLSNQHLRGVMCAAVYDLCLQHTVDIWHWHQI
jgi:hypothetical protein